MKSSSLLLLIMCVLTNQVYSKENNFTEVRKGKSVKTRYHFNRPPSAEYYNPIPVAVVYDDSDNYSGKSGIAIETKTDDRSEVLRKEKAVVPKHHLKHPPLEEYYTPIPAAVVYEDTNKYSMKSAISIDKEADNIFKEVRKGKSDELLPSAVSYNPIPVTIVIEDSKNYSNKTEISMETELNGSKENFKISVIDNEKTNENASDHKKSTNFTRKTVDNKNDVKLLAEPQNLSNLQIPVAVLYESSYNNYQTHKKRKTDTNTGSSKSSSNYSRKIETSLNSQEEQAAQISKEDTRTLKPKVDTRVFKKRTEDRDPVVPILEMESYVFSHNGNFHYSYEGGDGTKAYSEGKQVNIDDEAGESVVGGFSYKDKDGNDYSLTYTADENGYRPVGAHLPTAPPIPRAIARALEYLATATSEPEDYTKRPKKS